MYEPVGRFDPVLVDHEMNVWSATIVVTRVDGNQLHNAVRVSVPAATEPGLVTVESTGAVRTSRIGW